MNTVERPAFRGLYTRNVTQRGTALSLKKGTLSAGEKEGSFESRVLYGCCRSKTLVTRYKFVSVLNCNA